MGPRDLLMGQTASRIDWCRGSVCEFIGPNLRMRARCRCTRTSRLTMWDRQLSFEVHRLDEADKTQLATSDELTLIRWR